MATDTPPILRPAIFQFSGGNEEPKVEPTWPIRGWAAEMNNTALRTASRFFMVIYLDKNLSAQKLKNLEGSPFCSLEFFHVLP
jgi:hypothetical protein